MTQLPSIFAKRTSDWAPPALTYLLCARDLFIDVAKEANIGILDESLKWGQLAWRPARPRTGSTLRADWSPDFSDRIDFFVDCKTSLAAHIAEAFPMDFDSDGQRRLSVRLDKAMNADALWHLAFRTFTYHRARRASAS